MYWHVWKYRIVEPIINCDSSSCPFNHDRSTIYLQVISVLLSSKIYQGHQSNPGILIESKVLILIPYVAECYRLYLDQIEIGGDG
jgi:hypothetical protein